MRYCIPSATADGICNLSNGRTGYFAQYGNQMIVELPAIEIDATFL